MFDVFRDIRDFHTKFGLGSAATPSVPSDATVAHRKRMITEETNELLEAIDSGDLAKIAREAVDVLMVVLGTILVYGLPFRKIWNAVHKANMNKVLSSGVQSASKPIKPPGWQSPDADIYTALDEGVDDTGATDVPRDLSALDELEASLREPQYR